MATWIPQIQHFFGPKPPPVATTPPKQSWKTPIAEGIVYANAVYYPNYRVYRGDSPACLNYGYISHVFYAFASVGPDGGVILNDEYADAQMEVDGLKGCLGSFAAIKSQKPHLKVILSIGGGGSSQNFATVAASAALRDNFGRSARGLVTASGLDGIDIDWEYPSDHQQGQDFLSLLANVRLHLPQEENYVLTAALSAGQWALQHIDLHAAEAYLDFINLMAYDFSGPWTSNAGHQAQLFPENSGEPSGSGAVEYIRSTGFPSKKILLGIPVYGRSFLGATGPGDAYHGHGGEEGTFEYKMLPRPGTEEKIDIGRVAASCVGGDGGFVSYDNPETVKMKGRYCKENKLGGLFYWTGTADVAHGPRSLVEAGFNALHSA